MIQKIAQNNYDSEFGKNDDDSRFSRDVIMTDEDQIRKSNFLENQVQELQEELAKLKTEKQLEKKRNPNQVNFVDNDEGKAENYPEDCNDFGNNLNNQRYNNNSNWRNNNNYNRNTNMNPQWQNDRTYP